ncbi:unnamed protein product [Jaminaea pallidilutea]
MTNLTLYTITALLILDSSGGRIEAKYYSPPAAVAAAAANATAAKKAGASASAASGGSSHAALPPNMPRQLVQANPFSSLKEQRQFEKSIIDKLSKRSGGSNSSSSSSTEIQLLDNHLLLSKSSLDVHMVLVSPAEENELMVASVLSNLWEALSILLQGQPIEKRALLENLDLVTLAVDEAVDDGVILETDPATIASRVSRPRPDATEIQINEQTIMNAYSTFKERVAQRILQG